MVPWTGLVSVVLLATGLTLLAVRFDHTPGEKRVHLFETDRGERANPFADWSEGAARGPETCRNCGAGLGSASHRYCTTCLDAD